MAHPTLLSKDEGWVSVLQCFQVSNLKNLLSEAIPFKIEFSQVQPKSKKNSDPFILLFCFGLHFFLNILFPLTSNIDPSVTHEMRKKTLKKRKAEVALTIGEPSEQAVVAPKPEVILSDALEVAPLVMLKHS